MNQLEALHLIQRTIRELSATNAIPAHLADAEISANSTFDDLGLDSMDKLAVVLEVQYVSATVIDDKTMAALRTAGDLALSIMASVNESIHAREHNMDDCKLLYRRKIDADPFQYRQTPPRRVHKERSISKLSFIVMPGLPLEENLYIKEYRVWDKDIEALFDRDDKSTSPDSPEQLIFISSVIHLQKLIYVYLCHDFGLEYNPDGPEVLKIRPTRIDCKIPALVRETSDLIQTFHAESLTRRKEGSYNLTGISYSQNEMAISVDASILLMKKPVKR